MSVQVGNFVGIRTETATKTNGYMIAPSSGLMSGW